mmetsp:Transcript_12811/g.37190  ORF Transcript_12811/g.37190 Transcript_12811/m.37190 type:complete len:315 (+) Transcript_12811:548-1492(+)
MSSHAPLGHTVHLVGADLHLEGPVHAVVSGASRGVQGLVPVGLRPTHVVLNPEIAVVPLAVDQVQHVVGQLFPSAAHGLGVFARQGLGFEDDPHGEPVQDLLDTGAGDTLGAALLHLAPDAVGLLGAAFHRHPSDAVHEECVLDQGLLEDFDLLREHYLVKREALIDFFGDHRVLLRKQELECQFLEVVLELVHAQAMRQGCVHVQGLAGSNVSCSEALLASPHGLPHEGREPMNVVAQHQRHHTPVTGHRDEHVLQVRRLVQRQPLNTRAIPQQIPRGRQEPHHLGAVLGQARNFCTPTQLFHVGQGQCLVQD